MSQQCPECGAPVAGAPWCGECGARIAPSDAAIATASDADGPVSRDERWWLRRVAVVAVLGVLGSLVALRGQTVPTGSELSIPEDRSTGVGDEVVPPVLLSDRGVASRQFAPRGSAAWVRSDLPSTQPVGIRRAGAEHVLVGNRLLATAGASDDALRSLPGPVRDSVLDEDGRWAVAEFGRVVLGGVTTGVTDVVPDGWSPTGAAVAWHEGDPVLRDDGGRLGLLAADGTMQWRTAGPVTATGLVGERWLAGVAADGGDVAVRLADGRTVQLTSPALALVGDIAVTEPGDVVGVALPSGGEAWRRAATAATWRAVGDALVTEKPDAATRVDPETGDELDRVEGSSPLATDEVVVVRNAAGIEAITWSGRARWRLRLDANATLLAVDATRVAVRVAPPSGARITIIEAATGLVVADEILPAPVGRTLEVRGDELLVIEGDEVVAVVDRQTGADVDDADVAGPAPGAALAFGVGDGAVEVSAGVATLRGSSGDATLWTLPLRSPLAGEPVRSGTSVLVYLADGTVTSIAPQTGEPRWRRVLGSSPSAAASDGIALLVGTVDGEVLRLDPSGEVVTRTVVGTSAVEAIAAGRPAAALLGGRLVGIDLDG